MTEKYDNAIDCENACCETESCVSFQFREKEGCQWGGDTRLGAEKDGVPAWCEPRAPAPWKGQWIKKHEEKIDGACDDKKWNPKELSGQCFGLGTTYCIAFFFHCCMEIFPQYRRKYIIFQLHSVFLGSMGGGADRGPGAAATFCAS